MLISTYMKPLVDIDSQVSSMQADDSLGLHDLPRITSQQRVNETPVLEVPKNVTARQLADLPLSKLMRLASINVDSLEPGTIEGEYTEVDDE